MSEASPMTRTAIFHARARQGQPLAGRGPHAVVLVAEAPGCERWLVHQDSDDRDTVRVIIVDGQAPGGAPNIGETGTTGFPIRDAPDLSHDPGLLDRYELDQVAEARYVRGQPGAVQTGFTHYRRGPGSPQGWAHPHDSVDEAYAALAGSGHVEVDGDRPQLRRVDVAHVAPGWPRELQACAAGLEVLAFGTHVPGDGRVVADRRAL